MEARQSIEGLLNIYNEVMMFKLCYENKANALTKKVINDIICNTLC